MAYDVEMKGTDGKKVVLRVEGIEAEVMTAFGPTGQCHLVKL